MYQKKGNTVNSRFKKVLFPFLNQELFDLRNIYEVNLKTGRPKKMPYVGEFAEAARHISVLSYL